MPTVNVLPFDEKLKFSQRQRVKINNVAYDLFWRWNHQGEFCVLKIVRAEDQQTVFNGKLARLNPHEVKNPATYEVLFTMLPYEISSEKAEVWVFV